MIVLPWYIRLTFDVVIISTPFLYLNCTQDFYLAHPTTHLFEYFRNKRRIVRRLGNYVFNSAPEELGDNFNPEAGLNLAESKQLYKDLGIEY